MEALWQDFGIGRWKWRDCVGVKKCVDNHAALSKMKVGLYSQYMGGNSQFEGIARHTERLRTSSTCAVRWFLPCLPSSSSQSSAEGRPSWQAPTEGIRAYA